MKVVFLTPNIGSPGSFYEIFSDCLGVAARQLGVDLEVVGGSKQRAAMVGQGREILESPSRPDYLLLVNYMNVGQELVPLSASAGVSTFLVVEGMGRDEHIAASSGSEQGAGYRGEIVPDDAEAGRMLAEILTDRARERGLADSTGKIQVGILAGEHTHAANARFRGWMEVKKQHDDIVQAGFQYGSWEEEAGRSAAALLLQTAPGISVIWCANDAMALGARTAAIEARRRPGEDLLIGGVDLMDRALAEVATGSLEVSIGGHLIDGVRALLLLYDHHETRDLEPAARTTHLVAVRADEANRYLEFMKERAWRKADFTRFSRRTNPSASADDLSLHSLMSR
jgi:simple sugar transport system substrate-binding protein